MKQSPILEVTQGNRRSSGCWETVWAKNLLRKRQFNSCCACLVGTGERNTLLFSVIKQNKEIMSYFVHVDAGSFAVCHCKELTENPACRTFLLDPYFSYLVFFSSKESFPFQRQVKSSHLWVRLTCFVGSKQAKSKGEDGSKHSVSLPARGLLLLGQLWLCEGMGWQ